MKKNRLRTVIGLCLVMLAALTVFSACGKKKQTLHLFNWADYMAPEVVKRFETKYNCQVLLDTFDSNESMLAKIKAGGGGYDLIFPSSYMASVLQKEAYLRPIETAKIPNLKHVDQDYLRDHAIDKKMAYSVPYMLGHSGIAYRKDKVGEIEPSWKVFDRADLKGRMTMLNDMREVIGAALKVLGYSLNTTDEMQLMEALAVIRRWKANLAKFDAEAYKPGIASGEFLVVQGYGGDILQVRSENPNVAYLLPTEGFSIACDDMVIPKDAQEPDLAHEFINFMHDPANAAENTDYVYYKCPNQPAYALMSEEIRQDPTIFIPEELMKKAEIIRDLGQDNEKYIRVWDQVKSGQ